MLGKDDVNESDIAEMLEEYYRYIILLIYVRILWQVFSLKFRLHYLFNWDPWLIFRIAKLKGITSGPPSECGDVEEKPKHSKRKSKDLENKGDEKYIDYKGILIYHIHAYPYQ